MKARRKTAKSISSACASGSRAAKAGATHCITRSSRRTSTRAEAMTATSTPNDGPLKVWTERDGALLRLRLARPKANIVDAAMIGALQAAFDAHRGKTGILAALIDAEGPHFSFGASVEEHLA